jgi:hypothetical protein
MIRKLITVAVLAALTLPALFLTGCASNSEPDKPYALTGSSAKDSRAINDVEKNKIAARGDYSWKYEGGGTNGR